MEVTEEWKAPDKLREFDENAYCPKCGSREIACQYVAAVNENDVFYGREWREHIKRTCERCGYSWNEAPLEGE